MNASAGPRSPRAARDSPGPRSCGRPRRGCWRATSSASRPSAPESVGFCTPQATGGVVESCAGLAEPALLEVALLLGALDYEQIPLLGLRERDAQDAILDVHH